MSAMTSTSAFGGQVAFKASQPARRTSPAAPRRQQICCGVPAQTQAQQGANPVKLLVAGLAAAALLHGGMPAPAQAGVIMVKTEKKKVFQADDGAPKAAKSAPAVKEAKAAAGPSISLPSIGFNAAFLALPISIGGIGVLGLAVSKLDSGFNEFFEDTIVKNSNRDGFGYETYKENGLPTGGRPAAKTTSGTKKVVKKAAPAAKKAAFALPSFLKK